MHRTLLSACFAVIVSSSGLFAQTPTITSVTNESGSNSLCPGGIAFVNGTNLGGTSTVVTVGSKTGYVFNAFASLQFQIPVDAPLGATTVKAGSSAAFNVTLVQFCPGLPINNSLPAVYHLSSGAPVTASFPAGPNEQLYMQATGLGPTSPVIATGTSPNDASAVVVTKPTVSIGGKPGTGISAYLDPNNGPGFYYVAFTMPPDITTGNQNISISIGGLTSNVGTLAVNTGAIVGQIGNAASQIVLGPARGIAQGSIFYIKGINMGPKDIVISPTPFQSTILSGTSVSFTVAGTTTAALMYYTSAGQLAGLMPSNTPTGTGTVTVTYNGQAGPGVPVVVFANEPGIFTVTSDGNGAGIVTYPDYSLVSIFKASNCGGVYTTCGAANPGDVLIIWATGLGPVSGNEATGAGLGVNQPTIPLTVWLGNVPVTPSYQGRSGCCAGEDQIVFTVPTNTPTGCSVPLSLQIGTFGITNNVSLAVAPKGSRTCTLATPAFAGADVAQISTAPSFTFGGVSLRRQDNSGFQDSVRGNFFRVVPVDAVRPFFLSTQDIPPLNTCQLYNTANGGGPPNQGINSATQLNAGPQITIQGPNGTKTAAYANGYRATLSATGNYLAPGTMTISSPGGPDVAAFNVPITVPTLPTMTSPPPDSATLTSVTRANGLTVTWTGGTSTGLLTLEGWSDTDSTHTNGVSFACTAPMGAGTFTIPASILSALPTGNFGGLVFTPGIIPVNIPGTGLNVTQVALTYDTFTPLSFK